MSTSAMPGSRHSAKYPRPRGLADWQPQQKTLEFLATIRLVLEEYAAYLPLTIRQIFYRLVGAYGYNKTERAYKRLGETLSRARRARVISFNAIRDDGILFNEPLAWDSPRELIETFQHHAANFRLDRQSGQHRWLVAACEASGMVPQIERITDQFGLPVASGGGFDSLTAKYELAQRFGARPTDIEVLHIGDYDQSGVHNYSSLAEDVTALLRDLGYDNDVTFTRLAVTPEQITRLSLPTAEPKKTDRRAFDDDVTVQAEAIPPDELAQIIRTAIDDRIDLRVLEAVLDRERRLRQKLAFRLDQLLDEGWDDLEGGR
jgi:hypothetical protein